MKKKIIGFFKAIGNYFKEFGVAVAKGDASVKGSLAVMGTGYFAKKQIAKGIIMTFTEIIFVLMCIFYAAPNLAKFGTLGTVAFQQTFDPLTMQNTVNDYDNSFMILLNSIVSLFLILVFVLIYIHNIKAVYGLQLLKEKGEHINTFGEDVHEMFGKKFHITLLTLPVIGVVLMNVLPILVLIAIAFTNYDQNHMPPSALFSWVGFKNFKNLFSSSMTISFGYSFKKVLGWTLVWAVFATFTTFIGGILLAKLINHKATKLPKMWRTLFIVSIAVPQFVTLLLVRNFFADAGIVNTICSNLGVTAWLKSAGLISTNYIPFLTEPHWAKVMIILINIWVGVPYQMLIATGVLMNIPTDQIESARIDGANKFQIFWKITMPYILFIQGPALITDFVKNINNFNVIYLLTQDVYVTPDQALANSNAKEVDLLVTWLFRLTNEYYNYKMASVIGIIVFIICAAFTILSFSRMIAGNREEEYQ
jgi:arabinogalactan oligomer/maltooligosaccharide transport system permease protein